MAEGLFSAPVKYRHPAGRECEWNDIRNQWEWSHDGAPVKCTAAHPDPKKLELAERGDFGMPGIGSAMITHTPVLQDNAVTVTLTQKPATNQATRIVQIHAPEVLEHFIARNAEYGEGAHVLGVKGQFADINRKVIKLKRYLWDDVPVPEGAEDVKTIAGELIGHLLILIDELEDNE